MSLLIEPFFSLPDCLTDEQSCTIFRSLKPELVSLMLNAYYSEKDSLNLQMILGGFITLLEDTSIYELEQTFKLNDAAKMPKMESSLTNQTKDTLPGTVFTLGFQNFG